MSLLKKTSDIKTTEKVMATMRIHHVELYQLLFLIRHYET